MNALEKFVEHFGDYGKTTGKLGTDVYKVVAYICVGLSEFTMFFPVDERIVLFDDESIVYIMFALPAFAVVFLINHYVVQQEEGKSITIYKKLAYVPVEKKAVQKTVLSKLPHYIGITTIIAVIIQGGMTLLVCPQYIWQNLLYAVCIMGVIPFLLGVWLTCKK